MATWILILFVHVGPFGKTDSNSITTAPGFVTEQACQIAGEKAKNLTKGTLKELNFVCVRSAA